MAETNETTADIIAEMRDEAARADMEQDYSIDDAAEMMREFAWRIEAANRRERNRNFHRFATAEEAAKAWHEREAKDMSEEYCAGCAFDLGVECAKYSVCTIGWLYATATEKEGGAE